MRQNIEQIVLGLEKQGSVGPEKGQRLLDEITAHRNIRRSCEYAQFIRDVIIVASQDPQRAPLIMETIVEFVEGPWNVDHSYESAWL